MTWKLLRLPRPQEKIDIEDIVQKVQTTIHIKRNQMHIPDFPLGMQGSTELSFWRRCILCATSNYQQCISVSGCLEHRCAVLSEIAIEHYANFMEVWRRIFSIQMKFWPCLAPDDCICFEIATIREWFTTRLLFAICSFRMGTQEIWAQFCLASVT